jgi:hypothetical protein
MEFKDKIEAAVAPLVSDLRERLSKLPTGAVLDYYQFRIDLVQPDKSNMPDGFLTKCRYLWAILLSNSSFEMQGDFQPELKKVDELIEQIFEMYVYGVLAEPGRSKGSEKEFLTRLGVGLAVREPDVLAFPEQIREWALLRLHSFDASYFLPKFGLSFAEIMTWLSSLIEASQKKLNAWVGDLALIRSDLESVQAQVGNGDLDLAGARKRALELKIEERLERNASESDRCHAFSVDELRTNIPTTAVEALTEHLGILPGAVSREFRFPHDENPLEYKVFVLLPNGSFYFLDPANAYRVAAKAFEKELLADNQLRQKYLKNRDRSSERAVLKHIARVFPGALIYPNYYIEKGQHEKDILVHYGDVVLLIECKNSNVRMFKGAAADLLKFERDFDNSVQHGFEQALEVKRRILGSEESVFLDGKGRRYFSLKRGEIREFHIICVTLPVRGPFGTDLSYQLKKADDEPYPLALNLFDLGTICKHLSNPERFISYLRARERLHGRVTSGDELNYAGYFLENGNLDFPDGSFVADDLSGVFDRAWYKEKGIEVPGPNGPPVATTMRRRGNRIAFEHSAGRTEVKKVPAEWIERATGRPAMRMKGCDRNKPCPCGSGLKLKQCHGIT